MDDRRTDAPPAPPTHEAPFEESISPPPAAPQTPPLPEPGVGSSPPAAAAAAAAARRPKPRPDPADDVGANVKETLESILVAFILAFIFRCFVVEPFVIPTGSMAPTLMGAHSRFQCPDCGYRFDVNYSGPEARNRSSSADDIDIPERVQPVLERQADGSVKMVPVTYDDIHCPNCGLRLPPEDNPPVWYGDRILVLKYAYLLQRPQRWDVVVFKSPSERDYATNFIKRLIGTPGETIMVLDGDIYVKPRAGDRFAIATKTPVAQEALWRILYDNDFHPETNQARAKPWVQPWRQTAGAAKWDTTLAAGRRFGFVGSNSFATLTFNADVNVPDNKTGGFYDWISYDQRHSTRNYVGYSRLSPWNGECTVSDLKLDLYYSRSAGNGPLELHLSKLGHEFAAVVAPTGARLVHKFEGKEASPDKTAALPPSAAGPMHVEFMNVDYQVTLRINGKVVLQTTPAEYHPDIEDLMQREQDRERYGEYPSRAAADSLNSPRHNPPFPPPQVSITARDQTCELSHVSLWRDTYYTQIDANKNHIHWASFHQPLPGSGGGPITLGDDEFFVMGDNSPMSYDARFWTEPIDLKDEALEVQSGRVPGRFMLGKAFFVYWPAGFRPAERAPGIIPNFGQMRFIR
jgi:signal peptidase I